MSPTTRSVRVILNSVIGNLVFDFENGVNVQLASSRVEIPHGLAGSGNILPEKEGESAHGGRWDRILLWLTKLFVSQGFNRIQTRSPDGGHHSTHQPDSRKDQRGHNQRARSNDQANVAAFGVLSHRAV